MRKDEMGWNEEGYGEWYGEIIRFIFDWLVEGNIDEYK